MSLLKQLFNRQGASRGEALGGPTQPVRMSLEERMALRREMMFDVARSTLADHGLGAGVCRFRVVAADRRSHSFAVMVDLPFEYLEGDEGRPQALRHLGAQMAEAARLRFNLLVVGVYWRVDETLHLSDAARHSRAAPLSRASDAGDSGPSSGGVSADEIAAFEAAMQRGRQAQVGGRVYDSDVAPLDAVPRR